MPAQPREQDGSNLRGEASLTTDPTALTTAALLRELGNLKELIFSKIDSLEKRDSELKELFLEKFAGVARQFGDWEKTLNKLSEKDEKAIAAALNFNIPVFEYSPKKIKQSITGNGNASKEQVSAMLQQLLTLKEKPVYFDATDALAAAVCHYFQRNGLSTGKKSYKNWGAFLTDNPGRLS